MKLKYICFAVGMAIITALSGCGGSSHHNPNSSAYGEQDTLRYANNLLVEKIENEEGTVYVATVRNPWDTIKTLQKYVLIPKGMKNTDHLPADGTRIRVPVENALVYSSLHGGLIGDLGAADRIGGVCNARYITDKNLSNRVARGDVADCGDGRNPDIEKIIKLRPDLIMLSPFENNDRYAKVKQLGIPILECADYMESTPLGQAEWMKFYGILFGKHEEAHDRFDEIEARYNEIKAHASKRAHKPKVILDSPYNHSWSVPGGESTIGHMIEDAGGINPFASIRKSGGIQMAPEKVLAEAGDSEVWLVRYNQKSEKTLPELSRDAMVNSQFKAFKTGNVYGCNTQYIPFFDETPFHPDRLLEELSMIFDAETNGTETGHLRYFKKMAK
ncbi:MAG: ABC transporter substrate-binding protein [Muribaculaceae bacterium]|nr:ABC transporter substrate-binding protein [Muribaculaceae bacterium]